MSPAFPSVNPRFSHRPIAWYCLLLSGLFGYFVVVRACNFDNGTVLSYLGYLLFYVALPGATLLQLALRRTLAWPLLIALGMPTGFAIEILSFLGLSALHLRELFPFLPLLWLCLWLLPRSREILRPEVLLPRLTNPVSSVLLGLLFLGTILTAAGHMFGETPLAGGLPTANPFHDWIYLVSRAASIKNIWPLEDPSLAGASLQYHYFMMVHSAASSTVTGIELSVQVLRLNILPCGLILATQLYLLGRLATRSRWGGHLAIVLALMASEVSNAPYAVESAFLGRFIRWLYQSPTFYFGALFFGALLLVLPFLRKLPRLTVLQGLWLSLLAAAATGAKGTVIPVILAALALWSLQLWLSARRLPWRCVQLGFALFLPFLGVYLIAMSEWGSGATVFRPLQTLELSSFWREHHEAWKTAFASLLGQSAGAGLATSLCFLVVALGTEGVRCLALPWFIARGLLGRNSFVLWLGLVWSVTLGLGLLLDMDCYSQLYFLLLGQIPAAILASAALLHLAGALRKRLRRNLRLTRPGLPAFLHLLSPLALCLLIALTLGAQIRLWGMGLAPGLNRMQQVNNQPALPTLHLHEAMRWVRTHTERDAILVANTFTPKNLRRGPKQGADATWLGTHYFYSALSERRLYVEGPAYLLNQKLARERMDAAARIFYEGGTPGAQLAGLRHRYLLLDRALEDDASVKLPRRDLVYSNPRIDIYRIPDLTGIAVLGNESSLN